MGEVGNGLRKGRSRAPAIAGARRFRRLKCSRVPGHLGNREEGKLESSLWTYGRKKVRRVSDKRKPRDRLMPAHPKPLAALLTGYSHTGAQPSDVQRRPLQIFDARGGTVTSSIQGGAAEIANARGAARPGRGCRIFRNASSGKAGCAVISNQTASTEWTNQWCAGIERAISPRTPGETTAHDSRKGAAHPSAPTRESAAIAVLWN